MADKKPSNPPPKKPKPGEPEMYREGARQAPVPSRRVRQPRGTIGAMTSREKLHRLVDELSEAELDPTLRLVETQRHDPMLHALAHAPEDDEPWTDDDEAAVAESRADVAAGHTVSHEEMLRKYG